MVKVKKSNFGWKRGDVANYTYRSAKAPQGVVTKVEGGSTKKEAKVTINPYPHWRYGEGKITRHIDKVSHGEKKVISSKPIKKK